MFYKITFHPILPHPGADSGFPENAAAMLTAQTIIDHYQMDILPIEGTRFRSTYRSSGTRPDGLPDGTAMLGLYANDPYSASCFHRLTHDEVWHFYLGDPFELYLLYPDGSAQTILMGPHILEGQCVQFVVPAGVWQAGRLPADKSFALFGCTMAPGFTPACFEAGQTLHLTQQYPGQAARIRQLSSNNGPLHLPQE